MTAPNLTPCSKSPTSLGLGLRYSVYMQAFCYVFLAILQRLSGERGRDDSKKQPPLAVIVWASLFGQLVFTVQENQFSFIEEKAATHLLFIPVWGALTAYIITKLRDYNGEENNNLDGRWLQLFFTFPFSGTTCWVAYRCVYVYFHGCQSSNGLDPSTVIWILFFGWRVQGIKIVWTCIVCFANILMLLLPGGRLATRATILVLAWWIIWFGHEICSIERSLPENHIVGVSKSAWGVGQTAVAIVSLRSALDLYHAVKKMVQSRNEVTFVMRENYMIVTKPLIPGTFNDVKGQVQIVFHLAQPQYTLKIGTASIENDDDWTQAIQKSGPMIHIDTLNN